MSQLTITIIICSFWAASFGNSQSIVLTPTPAITILPVKTNASENTQTSTKIANTTKNALLQQPKFGTVKSIVNGDLLCYVTLLDVNKTEHTIGADFDICANKTTFLNKKVRAFYETVSVNDCQSAEPCGKTRQESIITKLELVEDRELASSNSQTISNGEWTITIGNRDSWSGVNGTGNLSYYGCSPKGKCIKLDGGRVTCRDGKCTTGWRNGDYYYILEEPINNPDRFEESESATTLTVRKGSRVILKATGFKVKYFSLL